MNPWMAVVGGLMQLYGGYRQDALQRDIINRAQDATRFSPYSISGPFGSVSSGPNNTLTINPELGTEMNRALLGGLATEGLLGLTPGGVYGQGFMAQGGEAIPGLFSDLLQTGVPSEALSQFNERLGGLTPAVINAGIQTFAPGQALTSQGINTAQAASQGLLGTNVDLGAANALLGAGAATTAAMPFDPTGFVNQRLSLLREQAAPFEERQFNTLQNRLFSQGRLGSTGGSRDIEAFARGLSQADLARQVQAQNLGLSAQAQSADILGRQAGLFGTLGNIQGSQALQLGAQNLSRFGTLGNIGLGQIGAGTGLFGTGGSLLGLGAQLAGQQYQGNVGFSNLINQRAAQRLAAAQGLFGFGSEEQNRSFTQGLQSLAAQQGIDESLRNFLALSGNLGGLRSEAGGYFANALLGMPHEDFIGSLFSSAGGGLFNAGLGGGGGGLLGGIL